MLQMLEQLQLPVSPLGEDRRAERLHDLLHCYRLAGELILGRAAAGISDISHPLAPTHSVAKTDHTRPKAPMPTGWRSVYLHNRTSQSPSVSSSHHQPLHAVAEPAGCAYLLVISNVVPKICARTNSAILSVNVVDYRPQIGYLVLDGWERSKNAVRGTGQSRASAGRGTLADRWGLVSRGCDCLQTGPGSSPLSARGPRIIVRRAEVADVFGQLCVAVAASSHAVYRWTCGTL